MPRSLRALAVVLVASILLSPSPVLAHIAASSQDDAALLKVRETVWHAWFDGDLKTLEPLVPPDTLVISASEKNWKHQSEILSSSAEFHAGGGKLLRLEFPRTEVQHFGDVAIIWSQYVLEVEENGKRSVSSGRASEIFVFRDGHWTNPGWHTDSVQERSSISPGKCYPQTLPPNFTARTRCSITRPLRPAITAPPDAGKSGRTFPDPNPGRLPRSACPPLPA